MTTHKRETGKSELIGTLTEARCHAAPLGFHHWMKADPIGRMRFIERECKYCGKRERVNWSQYLMLP